MSDVILSCLPSRVSVRGHGGSPGRQREKRRGGGNALLRNSLPIFALDLFLLAALAGFQLVALGLQLPAHIAGLHHFHELAEL